MAFNNLNKNDLIIPDKFSVNPPNVYGFGHKSYYEHVVKCIMNNGRI